MSPETTGIVRYGESSSIADVLTRHSLAGDLTAGHNAQETGIPGFMTEEQLARHDPALEAPRLWSEIHQGRPQRLLQGDRGRRFCRRAANRG